MSQAKVDARKQYKKNRKEILAKEKRNSMITRFVAYLVMIAVIGGFGYSFYKTMNPGPEANQQTFYSLIAQDSYGILTPSLPDAK